MSQQSPTEKIKADEEEVAFHGSCPCFAHTEDESPKGKHESFLLELQGSKSLKRRSAQSTQGTRSQDGDSNDDSEKKKVKVKYGIGYRHLNPVPPRHRMKEDFWRVRSIRVGPEYQASIPSELSSYDDEPSKDRPTSVPSELTKYNDAPGGELLWDPALLQSSEVEAYLTKTKSKVLAAAAAASPVRDETTFHSDERALSKVSNLAGHVPDNEKALYVLQQCEHNVDLALGRRDNDPEPKRYDVPGMPEGLSLLSEEECVMFELGIISFGKDFYNIQKSFVTSRSVGELVQFYYLWKKTKRQKQIRQTRSSQQAIHNNLSRRRRSIS